MLHRRDVAKFPPDVSLDIQAKEFNLCFIYRTRESCFSWSEIPLGAFWQTPSGLTAVAICVLLLAHHSLLKVNTDSFPCLLCAPEPVVHRRNLGLTLMSRRQNRLVPQYALEGREDSGGVAK